MPRTSQQLDTLRCKHCDAVIASLPRAAVVGRFSLRCLHCGVVLVIWPPKRKELDAAARQAYTEAVPV